MNQLYQEITAIVSTADLIGGYDLEFRNVIESIFECLDDYCYCGTHELAVEMLRCLATCRQLVTDAGALILIEDVARCVREFEYEQLK